MEKQFADSNIHSVLKYYGKEFIQLKIHQVKWEAFLVCNTVRFIYGLLKIDNEKHFSIIVKQICTSIWESGLGKPEDLVARKFEILNNIKKIVFCFEMFIVGCCLEAKSSFWICCYEMSSFAFNKNCFF